MERAILLFVILFSLSPLANASTPNAETDSIILYKDVFFRGTRLSPKTLMEIQFGLSRAGYSRCCCRTTHWSPSLTIQQYSRMN